MRRYLLLVMLFLEILLTACSDNPPTSTITSTSAKSVATFTLPTKSTVPITPTVNNRQELDFLNLKGFRKLIADPVLIQAILDTYKPTASKIGSYVSNKSVEDAVMGLHADLMAEGYKFYLPCFPDATKPVSESIGLFGGYYRNNSPEILITGRDSLASIDLFLKQISEFQGVGVSANSLRRYVNQAEGTVSWVSLMSGKGLLRRYVTILTYDLYLPTYYGFQNIEQQIVLPDDPNKLASLTKFSGDFANFNKTLKDAYEEKGWTDIVEIDKKDGTYSLIAFRAGFEAQTIVISPQATPAYATKYRKQLSLRDDETLVLDTVKCQAGDL